jgi:hypothetical protein
MKLLIPYDKLMNIIPVDYFSIIYLRRAAQIAYEYALNGCQAMKQR